MKHLSCKHCVVVMVSTCRAHLRRDFDKCHYIEDFTVLLSSSRRLMYANIL